MKRHEHQKIYVSMARISTNAEITGRYFGNSLQLTNWVLDSGTTCHMTPDISDYITGLLVETGKYNEVLDGIFFTTKQTGDVGNRYFPPNPINMMKIHVGEQWYRLGLIKIPCKIRIIFKTMIISLYNFIFRY